VGALSAYKVAIGLVADDIKKILRTY